MMQTMMEHRPQLNWFRLWVALAVIVFLGLFWWGTATVVMSDDRTSVEMLRMPGTEKLIPMPPKAMRQGIERRMRNGTTPRVVKRSGDYLNRICRHGGYLLGCAPQVACTMGIVYIRVGMSRELTHMATVHEIAHCDGWVH